MSVQQNAQAKRAVASVEQDREFERIPVAATGESSIPGSRPPIDGAERFQRSHRLRSSLDFQRVRQHGRHMSGALLALTYLRREGQAGVAPDLPNTVDRTSGTRVGFSVSKRVGGAVTRNAVKRRLRESARRRLRELAPGWDLVVTARSAAASADYSALDAELIRLLARARLLRRAERAD